MHVSFAWITAIIPVTLTFFIEPASTTCRFREPMFWDWPIRASIPWPVVGSELDHAGPISLMGSLGNGYLLSIGVSKLVRCQPGAAQDHVCHLLRLGLRIRPDWRKHGKKTEGAKRQRARDLMASVKQLDQPNLKQKYTQRLLITWDSNSPLLVMPIWTEYLSLVTSRDLAKTEVTTCTSWNAIHTHP